MAHCNLKAPIMSLEVYVVLREKIFQTFKCIFIYYFMLKTVVTCREEVIGPSNS